MYTNQILLGEEVRLRNPENGKAKVMWRFEEPNGMYILGLKCKDSFQNSQADRRDGCFRGVRFFGCTPGHGLFTSSNNISHVVRLNPGTNKREKLCFEHRQGHYDNCEDQDWFMTVQQSLGLKPIEMTESSQESMVNLFQMNASQDESPRMQESNSPIMQLIHDMNLEGEGMDVALLTCALESMNVFANAEDLEDIVAKISIDGSGKVDLRQFLNFMVQKSEDGVMTPVQLSRAIQLTAEALR